MKIKTCPWYLTYCLLTPTSSRIQFLSIWVIWSLVPSLIITITIRFQLIKSRIRMWQMSKYSTNFKGKRTFSATLLYSSTYIAPKFPKNRASSQFKSVHLVSATTPLCRQQRTVVTRQPPISTAHSTRYARTGMPSMRWFTWTSVSMARGLVLSISCASRRMRSCAMSIIVDSCHFRIWNNNKCGQ